MGQPAEWLQPRGEWGCSGRYHHADGCGDGRCAPWWRRFLSGSMFSVEPWSSVEVLLLSGRLRNSAVGAGLAGSEPSKACTLGLENPNPNPILQRSFSCRSCFMLQSAGVVGGSWVCGSSADILPTLPHTSGSGPSGAALFMQPPLRPPLRPPPAFQGFPPRVENGGRALASAFVENRCEYYTN